MRNEGKKIVGFGREHYLGPFTERGIVVYRKKHFKIGGVDHSNVDVISGLGEVGDIM